MPVGAMRGLQGATRTRGHTGPTRQREGLFLAPGAINKKEVTQKDFR